jgi:hypothetical protein
MAANMLPIYVIVKREFRLSEIRDEASDIGLKSFGISDQTDAEPASPRNPYPDQRAAVVAGRK